MQRTRFDSSLDANDRRWWAKYEELENYKRIHGNCLVPRKHPSLGEWVTRQRRAYKNKVRSDDGHGNWIESDNVTERSSPPSSSPRIKPMPEERIAALNALGFAWNVSDAKWWAIFTALVQYIEEAHEDDDDITLPTKGRLGLWVQKQRRKYASGTLSSERITALEGIGFRWEGPFFERWQERYRELCDFHRKHGHTNVPLDHGKLGVWVHNQRLHYSYYVQRSVEENDKRKNNENVASQLQNVKNRRRRGRPSNESSARGDPYSSLTPERISQLEDIGFVWDRQSEQWECRYRELEEFRKKHGHCIVPSNHNPLYIWVQNQKLQEDPTRRERLDRLNFCWSVEDHKWSQMLEQVITYYQEHGTFDIPTNDREHRTLRNWIGYQQKEHEKYVMLQTQLQQIEQQKQLQAQSQHMMDFSPTLRNNEMLGLTTSMTAERKKALDDIGFTWTGLQQRLREMRGVTSPTSKDWSALFDRLKAAGVDSRANAKKHIFDGEERFVDGLPDYFTEEDLLRLWHLEEDDDE